MIDTHGSLTLFLSGIMEIVGSRLPTASKHMTSLSFSPSHFPAMETSQLCAQLTLSKLTFDLMFIRPFCKLLQHLQSMCQVVYVNDVHDVNMMY